MQFSALIPFVLLLICFIGMKLPLTRSSFIALLSSSVICQSLFAMSDQAWRNASLHTLEISIEVGLILAGAFLFLEVAKETRTIDSLAKLIQQVTPNRIVQGILVVFPLELLVESSSGFGTPLLVITPILIALEFNIALCILLPFLVCVVATPFGALGTPIRMGFPNGVANSTEIVKILLPIIFIAPLLSARLISKKINRKEIFWIFSLSVMFASSAGWISANGPEFTALTPAFFTFIFGLISARVWFHEKSTKRVRETRGLLTYTLLIGCMWIGKQIFMDRLIAGTHIRIFNPGIVFILFSGALLMIHRSREAVPILKATYAKSKSTLIVFFCMALTVQELRESGALAKLSEAMPDFLLTTGSPLLGWLGCTLVGTSTVTNLMLSKVVDPSQFAGLAAGSAVGVQMAFQSLAAMRSISNHQLTEKEIFLKIMPISLFFIFVTVAWYAALTQF